MLARASPTVPQRVLTLALLCLPAAGLAQEPDAGLAPPLDLASLVAPPQGRFDAMHLLAGRGLHEVDDERWNAYGQLTYISSWKLPFQAAYTNLDGSGNSLSPDAERSFTGTVTAYLGVKLWPGAEVYFAPEVIAERPLSGLHGLGGAIQNFELQKTGGEEPAVYRARLYLRQTIGFGGAKVKRASDALQLGATLDARRVVLTVGNFSVLDFFDRNTFSTNPRQQFLNMVFMTHAAYDFASDARGYAWGGALELYFDDWALRFARVSPPQQPNQLPVSLHFDQLYGDQLELEHTHRILGRAGAVRLLGYRNRAVMGKFDEAIAAFQADPAKNAAACPGFNYGSTNALAPDLCWVRRPNVKLGVGVNVEQHLTDDVGVFFRGMFSDGQSEVQAYTSSDMSLSFGALAQGSPWRRPADAAGVGLGVAWISKSHAEYLRLGGVDGFIGDGDLRAAPEVAFDVFYSANLLKCVWVTLDYQHIQNPAFNADRGAVNIFSGRLHAEF